MITRGRHRNLPGKVSHFEKDFVVVTLDINGEVLLFCFFLFYCFIVFSYSKSPHFLFFFFF